MITVQQAAQSATRYLGQLATVIGHPTVEEVELTDDRLFWKITLSFTAANNPDFAFLGGTKDYKVFTIDANTAEVMSMKIRNVK